MRLFSSNTKKNQASDDVTEFSRNSNATTTTTSSGSNNGETDLTLKITTEYEQATLADQEMYTMLTLTAPEYESEERGNRAPIDIVCVIDKSGSMSGEKIELMKKTLLFMVEQLKAIDNISLVLFDSDIETPLQLTKMTEDGKKTAKNIIEGIRPGSCTNLSGGLLQGLDVVQKRTKPSDVASVLVFTDGLANEGITQSTEIVSAVQKKMQQIGRAVSVFTFGFGADHDANMLRAISESGNGLYYFLETVDAIPETFSDCLGGLLSVLGQNIKVQIETMQNGVEIGTILSSYKKNEIDPKNKVELTVGDIYSEESKNIIFTVKLPQVRSAMDIQQLFKITVNYFNVIKTENLTLEQVATVARVETMPKDVQPNPVLDKQRNRVECANALERGRNQANNKNLNEARKELEETIQRIQKSETAQDDFCQGLVQDLQDCLGDMKDERAYEAMGSKKMNNYWMSSNYERSTNTKSAAQACYVTKEKAKKKSAAKDFMGL